MVYSAVSFVFGEQPSAAKWNILGTNDASFNDGTGIANLAWNTTALSNPYKFRVYRNAAQTLGSATTTKIQFDAETYDTNSNFDSTTNYRYTAPVAGFYHLSARTTVNDTTNINDQLRIYKNGADLVHGNNLVGVQFPGLIVTDTIQLALSDYVEIFINHVPASTPGLIVGASDTYFSGHLVSRT